MAGYEVLFGIRYQIQTACRRPVMRPHITSGRRQECCAATRHATIIRLVGDKAGFSGGSPVGADANDIYFDVRSHAYAIESSGMTMQEQIFSFDFQSMCEGP